MGRLQAATRGSIRGICGEIASERAQAGLEDVLVEEATVDADLLERVGLGRLEAEDAQGADVRLRRRAAALRRRAAGK